MLRSGLGYQVFAHSFGSILRMQKKKKAGVRFLLHSLLHPPQKKPFTRLVGWQGFQPLTIKKPQFHLWHSVLSPFNNKTKPD